MSKGTRYTPEQIITKLREAEVLQSQGINIEEAARKLGIASQTYYRWRKEYGDMDTTQAERSGKREPAAQEIGCRFVVGQCDLEGGAIKKVISPDRRREAVDQVKETLPVSERRACRVIGQPRATQRYPKRMDTEEDVLREQIVSLASQYGRYGYRRVTAMLRSEGWLVNHKRVERIWRQEGLRVPAKQPKRSRLWFTDGSIVRLRPQFAKHVWSYDFMQDHTHNGVPFRILNVIDEYTRECLRVNVARRLTHKDVLEVLLDLFLERGVPVHIRSDNGSEFIAKKVRQFLSRLSVKPLFIEPGSPWENGYIESFNGKMRDELLAREIFYSLKEAQVLIEMWRRHYNTARPHSALGYRPPAPGTKVGIPSQIQPFSLTL
jgi:putative transposase